MHGFAERPAIAAGEAAGPLEAGDSHRMFMKEFESLLVSVVGEFVTPDPDGFEAVPMVVNHIIFETPTQCGEFTNRETRYLSKLHPAGSQSNRE